MGRVFLRELEGHSYNCSICSTPVALIQDLISLVLSLHIHYFFFFFFFFQVVFFKLLIWILKKMLLLVCCYGPELWSDEFCLVNIEYWLLQSKLGGTLLLIVWKVNPFCRLLIWSNCVRSGCIDFLFFCELSIWGIRIHCAGFAKFCGTTDKLGH